MKDAAGSEAGMEKGMARSGVQHPQEPALSCGAVTEKACLRVLYRQSSALPSTQPAVPFEALVTVLSWRVLEIQ